MFILPIKSTYVSDWGTWETLREIIQNAKDEEEQHGNKMTVRYERDWLRVANHGADLGRKALLLGESGKVGRDDLRGRFGEGLDLALLAGVRAGYEMRVYTKTEIWTPSIEFVEKFDDNVLVVRTSTRQTAGPGVEVRIKMPLDDWLNARKLFRFLVDDDPEFLVHVDAGTILLHPDRQGQVYVKGIYITTVSTLSYGYDLRHVRLDRDRRMVDSWDLRWELSKVLRDGVEKDPEKLGPAVYGMLKRKTEDVGALEHNSSEAFATTMAAHFQTEYGEAIPVTTMAESQSLDHLGAKGVVVSDTLRKVLERKLKSADAVRRELTRSIVAESSWHDLEAEEQATLTQAVQLLHDATADIRATSHLPPLLNRLTVAVFKDETLRGTCDGTGIVKIARRELIDLQSTLRVLVHEEAHAVSFASPDGSKEHVDAIQDIWAALYFGRS